MAIVIDERSTSLDKIEALNDPEFFRILDASFLVGNPIVNWSYLECKEFIREAVLSKAPPSRDLIAANARLVFWEAYKNIGEVSSFPFTVAFPLTDLCNARCQFCAYVPERVLGRNTGIAEFERLDWLKFVSTLNLNCGLGEPMMHPDFAEIIQFLKRTNPFLKMAMITNGSLLNDKNIDAVLNYIPWLKVSLNATRKETYETSMKIKWADTIDGLKRLADRKAATGALIPKLRLSFVIHRHNIDEIPEIPGLAKELGAEAVVLHNMLPIQKRWSDKYDHLLTVNDCIENYADKAIPALLEFKSECIRHGVDYIGSVPLVDDLAEDTSLSDTGEMTQKELKHRIIGNITKRDLSYFDGFKSCETDIAPVKINGKQQGQPTGEKKAKKAKKAKKDNNGDAPLFTGFVRQVIKGYDPTCADPWKMLRVGIRDEITLCCKFFGGMPKFDWNYASAEKFHHPAGTWNSPPLQLMRRTMNRPPEEMPFCTGCRTDRKQDPAKGALFRKLKLDSLRRANAAYEVRFNGNLRDGVDISNVTVDDRLPVQNTNNGQQLVQAKSSKPKNIARVIFKRQVHEYRRIVEVNGMRMVGHILMLGADEAMVPFLAEANEKLTVVDVLDRDGIGQIANHFKLTNIDFRCNEDLSNLHLGDNSIDAVWLRGPAIMVSQRDSLFKEISRVMKPGALMTLQGYQCPGRVIKRYATSRMIGHEGATAKSIRAIRLGPKYNGKGNHAGYDILRRILLKNKLRIRDQWGHTFGKNGREDNDLLSDGYPELAKRLAADFELVEKIASDPEKMLAGIEDAISLRIVKRL